MLRSSEKLKGRKQFPLDESSMEYAVLHTAQLVTLPNQLQGTCIVEKKASCAIQWKDLERDLRKRCE